MIFAQFLCITLLCIVDSHYVSYSNYDIINFPGLTRIRQGQIDARLAIKAPSAEWLSPTSLLVVKSQFARLEAWLTANNIAFHEDELDIQSLINEERAQIHSRRVKRETETDKGNDFDFHTYHSYSEIQAYLNQLRNRRSDLVELISIRKSYEKREMLAVKISNRTAQPPAKPALLIMSGMHSREWATVAATLYLIGKLTSHNRPAKLSALLNVIEVYVIPVVNPDGYEYSWTTDRMWRKNRSGPHCSMQLNLTSACCMGVDLNRNFETGFYDESSDNRLPHSCENTYHGVEPLSEPESRNIAWFVRSLISNGQLKAVIDVHASAQAIIRPYAYTETRPPNTEQLKSLSERMASSILSLHGIEFDPRQGGSVSSVPATTGTAMDFITALGVPLTLLMEMRKYQPKFLQPIELIEPTSQEVYVVVLEMISEMLGKSFDNNKMSLSTDEIIDIVTSTGTTTMTHSLVSLLLLVVLAKLC